MNKKSIVPLCTSPGKGERKPEGISDEKGEGK